MTDKLFASSQFRYRASASEKRTYGGSTVTDFLVGVEGSNPSTWMKIRGFGRTPGERATFAKARYRAAVAAGKVRADWYGGGL